MSDARRAAWAWRSYVQAARRADGQTLVVRYERLAASAEEIAAHLGVPGPAVAAALADWTLQAARREGLDRVALGGGCFANEVLATALRGRLESGGLRVLQVSQ